MPEKKGKLAQIKTKQNEASVEDFINSVAGEQKREDSYLILEMMKKAMNEEPKMWGTSIIGFGNVRYKSPSSGREVDWFKIGLSLRKANITIYFVSDLQSHKAAFEKLGKHKLGGGCLYINKLADIDLKVLKGMIESSAKRK